jgi:putative ABC transport system substrate-binding protein
MTSRRVFVSLLAVGLLAAPLLARAQPTRVYRIGWLLDDPIAGSAYVEPFKSALRAQGYVEDRNLVFLLRSAEGNPERLPGIARELVALNPDIVLASGFAGVQAAKRATSTIPIVMLGAPDPVRAGLVASLARPGGNVTGASNTFYEVLTQKSLELIRDLVPDAKRVAVFMAGAIDHRYLNLIQDAARVVDMTILPVAVTSPADLERAFSFMARQNPSAVIVPEGEFADDQQVLLIKLLIAAKLPSICMEPDWAQAGGLLSYGPTIGELVDITSKYVDRIFKGAKPAELPILQPARFELAINLRTAKAINLEVSAALLGRADKIIK